MIEASPRAFVESRDVSGRQQFLSPHPAEELSQHELLMNRDGTVGISIDEHGDIQNVFNNGGPNGAAPTVRQSRRSEHGGNTLDCYDGLLPSYYAVRFQSSSADEVQPGVRPAVPRLRQVRPARHCVHGLVWLTWGRRGCASSDLSALPRVRTGLKLKEQRLMETTGTKPRLPARQAAVPSGIAARRALMSNSAVPKAQHPGNSSLASWASEALGELSPSWCQSMGCRRRSGAFAQIIIEGNQVRLATRDPTSRRCGSNRRNTNTTSRCSATKKLIRISGLVS